MLAQAFLLGVELWCWSSGQRVRFILWRFEFETYSFLKDLCLKTTKINKKRRGLANLINIRGVGSNKKYSIVIFVNCEEIMVKNALKHRCKVDQKLLFRLFFLHQAALPSGNFFDLFYYLYLYFCWTYLEFIVGRLPTRLSDGPDSILVGGSYLPIPSSLHSFTEWGIPNQMVVIRYWLGSYQFYQVYTVFPNRPFPINGQWMWHSLHLPNQSLNPVRQIL